MPGRQYNAVTGYRYGFNGKENDNEVKGEGNQQDYGMRIYDPRLGRFLSVDPLYGSFAMLTPYQFASNTPIAAIDLDGLEAKIVTTYSYTNTKGTLIKRITVRDVKNPFNLWKGVLNIAIHYKNQAPNAEASTVAKYTPQTFLSKASEINLWFGERKNEFGFVLTGNGNGTSLDIGSDGVKFKENLDVGSLLSLIGGMRDLGADPASISDFMKSAKFKIAYTIVENSMKASEKMIEGIESPTSEKTNSRQSDTKLRPVTVINKPFESKDNSLWPDTLESIKTSFDKNTPDTIIKTPIIKK